MRCRLWGCPWLERLLEQILVVVASTPSGEVLYNSQLDAVEDWSGAGFHIKQPLNVGQPTVSQVVSSLSNQSCPPPSGALVQEWQTGKHVQHSAVMWEWGGRRVVTPPCPPPSRLRGGGTPEEFSFPPDADPCGLSIASQVGGVSPPLSKAVWSPCWWSWLCLATTTTVILPNPHGHHWLQ